MIPQLVTVKVKRHNAGPIRVWVPVLPLLLILSPILVLAVVAGVVACLMFQIRPIRALGAGWRIMSGLRGVQFDIEHGHSAVLVSIR